jgi:hypothetical protein
MGAISFSLDESLLRLFQQQLAATCFVETGTFRGETLAYALTLFDRCYSVEKSPAYHQRACERFGAQDGLVLALGDSPEFLAEHHDIFAAGSTVFWLDAHWCHADETAGEQSQTPLLEELAAIGSLGPNSAVLIDDARLYLAPPPAPHRIGDWPGFHDVAQGLLALGTGHRLMVLNDVILFYPDSMRESLSGFAAAHGVDWLGVAGDARSYRALREQRSFRTYRRLARLLGGRRRSPPNP